MNIEPRCPCQSGQTYAACCAPLHQGARQAVDAEALMRSRYSAYVRCDIDYIVATTVPAQQVLLDGDAMRQWSAGTQWCGLEVLQHWPRAGKHHAEVEFKAWFDTAQGRQYHHERSAFVCIAQRWYFLNPTVPLPGMKTPCLCGSGKKFKQCSGVFFRD
mgnify:FL=1